MVRGSGRPRLMAPQRQYKLYQDNEQFGQQTETCIGILYKKLCAKKLFDASQN